MWKMIRVATDIMGTGTDGAVFQADATKALPLLEEYRGKLMSLYIDPPYTTGDKLEYRIPVGEMGYRTGKPYLLTEAYTDRFSDKADYVRLLQGLVGTAHELLSDAGTLFLHIDYRASACARLVLDEIMGEDAFANEIIGAYESGGRATRHFSRKHDVILMYQKSKRAYFDAMQAAVKQSGTRSNHMKSAVDEAGRRYRSIKTNGKEYRYYDDALVPPSDVWTDISHLQQRDPERTGYATQKPLKLLKRIFAVSSREGDMVGDLCFGSGTSLEAAYGLKRRFLGVDASFSAQAVVRMRMAHASFSHYWPSSMEDARLDADVSTGEGKITVTLHAFTQTQKGKIIPAEYEVLPLDGLAQWSLGILRDGKLHVRTGSARSKKSPAIAQTLTMLAEEGQLAVEIMDVMAQKHVFVWAD